MFKQGLTIWYNVTDLKETKYFFEVLLGFEVIMDDESGGMVIMKTPTANTEIGFSKASEVLPSTASVVFEVENIENSIQTLTQKGIQFEGGIDIVPGLVKLVTFRDPDGNSFMLAESIAHVV